MDKFPVLPSDLNIPRYRYKIITDEKTYFFFKSNNRKSLKEIIKMNRDGMEEEVKEVNESRK